MPEACFSLRWDGGCRALNVRGCSSQGSCPFFMTLLEHEEDLEAASVRLRVLPEEVQRDIAWKYHKGRMPWRENER